MIDFVERNFGCYLLGMMLSPSTGNPESFKLSTTVCTGDEQSIVRSFGDSASGGFASNACS
jgi:hypothetical protein